MSDTAQGRIDLDTLTDDEVMNLSPDDLNRLMEQEAQESQDEPVQQPSVETEDPDHGNQGGDGASSGSDPDDGAASPGVSGDADDPENNGDPSQQQQPSDPDDGAQGQDPSQGDGQSPEGKPEGEAGAAKEGDDAKAAKEADKPADKPGEPGEPGKPGDESGKKLDPETSTAVDFYKKLTLPFKADGRDFQVRSAEDAIRLMQQGVNYSRRMQEMKPLKAMDAMLREHGLNDPEKLSFLIDIHKGDPNAIQKLLKEKGIDPIDIDTSKETEYRAKNYQPDSKTSAFQDAIEETLRADGGRELIVDINASWDDQSKEALKDQPVIFQNILAQKQTGVYGKIKAELEYQRTMGYLRDVPFLQAYHQVGDAMQKAGVFNTAPEVQSGGAAVPPQQSAPIDTGTRKAAQSPKTEQPNPNLSSTAPPRVAPPNGGNKQEPDYSSMSDEDFLKLGIPG